MVIGWNLSSSGLELVAGHGCGVAVELGRLRGVSSSVPARGSDCVSQDPSHDGVDKSGISMTFHLVLTMILKDLTTLLLLSVFMYE